MTAAPFVGLLVGFLATAVLWTLAAPILDQPLFRRENFRGRQLVTSSGLVLAPMMMFVAAVVSIGLSLELALAQDVWLGVTVATLLCVGLVFLGLLDDLAGDATSRGLRGHVGAAVHGRLTTGMIKLTGTVSLSFLVAALLGGADGDFVALFRIALVIALSTNLANLFDLAPARTAKVSLLVWLVAAALNVGLNVLFGPALVVGGVLLLTIPELKERSMLGDAGANAIGGAIGLTVVLSWGSVVQWAVVAVALLLTLLSERVSFSRVIRHTPVLSWLDMLGREPLDPPG